MDLEASMQDQIRFKMRGKYATLEHTDKFDKDALGSCDDKTRRIRIRRGLKGVIWLDTAIHELLHLALWDLDEDVVNRTATDMARVLTKLGVVRDLGIYQKNLAKIEQRRHKDQTPDTI